MDELKEKEMVEALPELRAPSVAAIASNLAKGRVESKDRQKEEEPLPDHREPPIAAMTSNLAKGRVESKEQIYPILMTSVEKFMIESFSSLCFMGGDTTKLTLRRAEVMRALINRTSIEEVFTLIDLVIFDTGASRSICPNRKDFIGGIKPCDVVLRGIGSGPKAEGLGRVRWRFRTRSGKYVEAETEAYYVRDYKSLLVRFNKFHGKNASTCKVSTQNFESGDFFLSF